MDGFKIEKMYKLPDCGSLKAFFDFSFNDVLVVKGARILKSKKGLFVAMPQEQGRNHKWYDQVVFKNMDAYAAFAALAIDHYKAV